MISIADLLELVKGDAKKYIPQKNGDTVGSFSFKEDSGSESEANSQTAEKKPSHYTKGEARAMVEGIISTFFTSPEYD